MYGLLHGERALDESLKIDDKDQVTFAGMMMLDGQHFLVCQK
jgi:hypothetical protein